MNDALPRVLERAVEKASLDTFFLGHLFSFVARRDQLSQLELAKQLGCEPNQITRLALCRCPREDVKWFRQDIKKIAAFARCNPTMLAQIVRKAMAIKSLSACDTNQNTNTLLAARDRLASPRDSTDPKGGEHGQ
jgi:hypothetical protein